MEQFIHEKTGIPYNEMVSCTLGSLIIYTSINLIERYSMTMRCATEKCNRSVSATYSYDAKPYLSKTYVVILVGVTFIHVLNGLDDRVFEQGLEEWRRRHPVEVIEDAGGDQGHDISVVL